MGTDAEESIITQKPLCEHKFVYIDTQYFIESKQGFERLYVKTDRFFCEKCLVIRKIRKEEWAENKPFWFNG